MKDGWNFKHNRIDDDFKKQVEAKDIPDEMKDWFKKNYPGKDWGKDLNLSQRAGAKLKFENRNKINIERF